MKKKNYLKWDEYFMGIALPSAEEQRPPYKRRRLYYQRRQ